jgi:hypothetical protein
MQLITIDINGALWWLHKCHPCPSTIGMMTKLGGETVFKSKDSIRDEDDDGVNDLNYTPAY